MQYAKGHPRDRTTLEAEIALLHPDRANVLQQNEDTAQESPSGKEDQM